MNPQALHWTRSTQSGGRSHTRLARKGDTRAGLSRRISLSQITQLETSIISFVLPPSAPAAAAAYRAASGETRISLFLRVGRRVARRWQLNLPRPGAALRRGLI